jgi:delta(3,5)-delta(2,4)-dienoyl-CoA isomerase
MWKEIGDAFFHIGTTGDGCRCILMIGSGKGFCGGIDVTDEKFFSGFDGNHTGDDNSSQDVARKSLAFRSQILQMQSAFTAVEKCPVPVVAAIHGACIGAGVDLTCCADVRVCSPDAKFSIREVRLGLAADVGTLQRFPKLVGFGSRVRELCFTGGELINLVPIFYPLSSLNGILFSSTNMLAEDFSADDALKIGFVSRISPTNQSLIDTANDICQRISRNSPVAATITKASLNFSRDHAVSEGLEHVALHNSTALMSEDLVKSFMMKGGAATHFEPLHSHSRL